MAVELGSGGPGADPRPLANERTLVFCAVLSLSSPLIPAAPLTKTRHSEMEEEAWRTVANELPTPPHAWTLFLSSEGSHAVVGGLS